MNKYLISYRYTNSKEYGFGSCIWDCKKFNEKEYDKFMSSFKDDGKGIVVMSIFKLEK